MSNGAGMPVLPFSVGDSDGWNAVPAYCSKSSSHRQIFLVYD